MASTPSPVASSSDGDHARFATSGSSKIGTSPCAVTPHALMSAARPRARRVEARTGATLAADGAIRRVSYTAAMAKFTGTVQKNDLEGGFYELKTDDGDVYRLEGGGKVSAGDKVTVHGTVESGGFGIHMSGPAIKVDKIEPK